MSHQVLEQLKVYLDREPHARLGVWFNGVDFKVIYKTPGGFEIAPEGTPIPRPSDPLGPVGARVLTDADLRKAPSLIPVFRRIRDRLAALDRNINRDEEILPDISLLLLLKILDEQRHRLSPRKPLQFQIDETPEKTAARMRALLEAEVKKESQLFGANGREIGARWMMTASTISLKPSRTIDFSQMKRMQLPVHFRSLGVRPIKVRRVSISPPSQL